MLTLARTVAAGTLACALGGCDHYPKTPELALGRIEKVVTSGDGIMAWDIVDPDTRKAAQSALSDERLMQTIIRAKYPPAEAERELARLAAADEPDAAHFFDKTCKSWGLIESFRKRLGSVSGPAMTKPDGDRLLWVSRADGMPFHIQKVGKAWAWMELRAEWQLEKDRASHAVKTVQDNAALYKKAGAQ